VSETPPSNPKSGVKTPKIYKPCGKRVLALNCQALEKEKNLGQNNRVSRP
jgi:hypothetical protein